MKKRKQTKQLFTRKIKRGYSLVELLVVIAILAVLAALVLGVIDPAEQFARSKDAGRKSSVTQLGKAIQGYFSLRSTYPSTATWDTELSAVNGDLKIFPSNPPGTVECGENARPNIEGYCYSSYYVKGVREAIVFVHLESKTDTKICEGKSEYTWYIWSSAEGGTGILCQLAAPRPGIKGLLQDWSKDK